MKTQDVDYSKSGMMIQQAMLDHCRQSKSNGMPRKLRWGSLLVSTADVIPVSPFGLIRAEFRGVPSAAEQGFDLEAENGWMESANGRKVKVLRTWYDSRYEPQVEYRYHSNSGRIWVWNVYKQLLPDGRTRDEKWTGNAGLWVDILNDGKRVYHCSSGLLAIPNFQSLEFSISIIPEQEPNQGRAAWEHTFRRLK